MYLGNLLSFGGGGGFVSDSGVGTEVTAVERWSVGSDSGTVLADVTLEDIQPVPASDLTLVTC